MDTMRLLGVLALLLLGGALPGCGGPGPEPERPRSLLLLSVDTLRADHLGAWGHPLDTSPALDALAARGVRFADASVQWTKTWPSMASMLTGTYPNQTGIRFTPRRPLPERNRTLAEVLRERGYRTAAVVSNANLGRRFAFDQGFEHFVESWMAEHRRRFGDQEFRNRPGLTKQLTTARRVSDEGLAWLDALAADEPFFLWLHFMEPHGPYQPPERLASRFRGAHPVEPVQPRAIPGYQRHRDDRGRVISDLGFYRGLYDGEILHFDEELRRLLDELETRGALANTILAFTSDHGESLGEHGLNLEHGLFAYQPTAHVPLVLVGPEGLPAGRVVEQPVGLVDLVPTLLDLLGEPVPEGVAGRSLVPLIAGNPGAAPPYVYVEAGEREPSQRAVRRGPWKLVQFRAPEDRRRFRRAEWELYRVDRDPAETENLARAHPEVVDELREALTRYDAVASDPAGDGGDLELDDLDEQTRSQLQALGYLGEEDEEREPEGGAPAP